MIAKAMTRLLKAHRSTGACANRSPKFSSVASIGTRTGGTRTAAAPGVSAVVTIQ
jgi:hypothetical protein